MSAADDLRLLPPGIASVATVDANGEVWWRSGDAEAAVGALADVGLLILGLDLREYDDGGQFYEIAWSEYEPTGSGDVEQARRAALVALARPDRTGNAVLITWQGAR
jgi:hypothetical protein